MNTPEHQTENTSAAMPGITPPASASNEGQVQPPATPTIAPQTPEFLGNPKGPPAELLKHYENIVTQNLGNEVLVAEAIAQIKIQKLNEVVHQTFGDYVRARWDFSRSRAYQLIKFARLREQALATGKTPPANERAARNMDAAGNPSPARDSYPKILAKVKNLIKGILAKLPQDLQIIIIAELHDYLEGLAYPVPAGRSNPILTSAMPTGSPADRLAQKVGAPPVHPQSNQPTSKPPTPPPLPPTTTRATEENGNLEPLINYGGTTPMTMEQAKKMGYLKRR